MFAPIAPDFDIKTLVEKTPNFSFVDRIPCDKIDEQGMVAFEKLVIKHVIVGGKPLVIEGWEGRLDPWTFSQKWLRDNCGDKVENARNLTTKEELPLTTAHYLKNMGKLTNQFFDNPTAYKEKGRQRVYLKDIDCPEVWREKIKENLPDNVLYLNESTGDVGGPGAMPDSSVPGRRLGKGIARAGDLMSSLPQEMRAENLLCYIGHEGTYTPAHREMCASLGHNIMVEASGSVSDDGKPEKPGSAIWFMTESKDRHIVSEYWLSVLGHDIEVEDHFAQVVAWRKAPFTVYVLEQVPGDFILIPPLAPHQVWNRGTRTMKVAWNRTTVETLEMALNEALPRSRIVCRDEQYKNKAIVYYTLQKYSGLLTLAQQQAAGLPPGVAQHLLYSRKLKQLLKDFKRLFSLYQQVLLSEMFNPEDTPKPIEYLPFDSNVTCAYCRGNVFNRFLTCPNCKDQLGHNATDGDGDPYDVCMDCYAMGRSCGCVSGLKWIEQFRWKELASRYETWRNLIITYDHGHLTAETSLTLVEEKARYAKASLAEVCKQHLKRRPWKDVSKPREKPELDDDDEEIVVGDDGMVKKVKKKKPKNWHKTHTPCHVCKKGEENWKLAFCTTCDKAWCYGSLFRGWDKMPLEIMEDLNWSCPHCLGICFAGTCRKDERMQPYEPKGTLLGHDTKKVADARSVEALVDFSFSNLNWLRDNEAVDRTESSRIKRAQAEAEQDKAAAENGDLDEDHDDAHNIDQSRVDYEYAPEDDSIDPALRDDSAGRDENEHAALIRRLRQANSALPGPLKAATGMISTNRVPDGYTPVRNAGYAPPVAQMYPGPDDDSSYAYPVHATARSLEPDEQEDYAEYQGLRPFKRVHEDNADGDFGDLKMTKIKKPRMSGAGFRSSDLAEGPMSSKTKSMAQKQFEQEKERKALDKAKADGRFIMMSAALKGKKRVVKLRVPGARLGQLLAMQAAKVALPDTPADGDVEDDALHLAEPMEAAEALLQSDLPPKKTAERYHEQRKDDGFIISSSTKTALIPVERDENYNDHSRFPSRKVANGRAEKPRTRLLVDYEEVDVGSDDEFDDEGAVEATTATRDKKRRAKPGYLQNRHGDDEEEQAFPEELPETFRDRNPAVPKYQPTHLQRSSGMSLARRTAGKRPSMRPAENHDTVDDISGEESVESTDDVAANGDSIHIDRTASSSLAGASSNGEPSTRNPALSKQTLINEENRLAKLQALEMMDVDEDSDNDPDDVPARAWPSGPKVRPPMIAR